MFAPQPRLNTRLPAVRQLLSARAGRECRMRIAVVTKRNFVTKGIKSVVSPEGRAICLGLRCGGFVSLAGFGHIGLLRPYICDAGAEHGAQKRRRHEDVA
jgi:hypothetical protein